MLAPSAQGTDIIHGLNTANANLGTTWVGGAAPSSSDVAVWDSTVTGANSSALGANVSWQGIKIIGPGGLVTLGTTAEASVLTLGSSGINMSAATQNLLINTNLAVGSTNQTWTVASGRSLSWNTVNISHTLVGSATISLRNATGSGTATFDFRPGASASTAFTAQSGFSGFTGNWDIGANTRVMTLRNGINAWGSGTIYLNGGTVGQQQNFSGAWTNSMVLGASTTSTIDDFNTNGSRYLQLNGVISGSGNLTFQDTNAGVTTSKDITYTLAATNTMSGTVTIASGAFLRVGGIGGNNNSTTGGVPLAGTVGTLGTAAVTVTGGLAFTRTDTWTVANVLSGAGVVYVGSADANLAATSTQVLTLSGGNSYSGGTELLKGALTVNALSGIGSGYLAAKNGSTFNYSGTTASTTRLLYLDNGAATINVTDANAILTWSDAAAKGGSFGALITKGGAGTLVLDGAITSGGTTAVTVSGGVLQLNGLNTYTGATTIAAGTFLEVSSAGSLASNTAISIGSGGGFAFTSSANQTISSAITGVGALTMSGSNTLTLSSTSNTYAGGTSVSAGTLALGVAGVLADAGAVTVSGTGALSISAYNETIGALSISGGSVTGTSGTLTTSGITAAIASGAATLDVITAGTGALTKSGNGNLTLSKTTGHTGGTNISGGTLSLGVSNVLDNSGTVTISGGTLALGANSDTVGSLSISSGNITGSGTLTVSSLLASNAAASSISANIAGSGGLTKSGSGDLTLSGTNTYSGATTVSNGKLIIATGASIASSSIVLGNSTELQTVDGLTLSSGRSLSLGSGISVASATHTGNLTLSGGSITIDFGASAHDILAVVGDLSLVSGSLNFSNVGTFATGYYNLLTYTGAYTAPTNVSDITLVGLSSDGTSRQTFSLFHDVATSAIQLNVGGQAQNVNWNGTTGSTWDAGVAAAENWTVTSTYSGDQPNRFFNGDAVTFADGASTGSIMIGAANVEPASISITSDSLNYTIGSSGGGKITSGSISKSGASALTLSVANTFNGGTTLNAGRLRLGADGAAGTGLLTINGGRLSAVGSTARLIANNVLFASDVSLGDATDNGVLTLAGTLDLNGVSRTLTLDSDIVVSGTFSNGSLVKVGSGKLTLSGSNAMGVNLTVNTGTVALGANDVIANTADITVSNGATLDLAGYSDVLNSLTLGSGSTVTAGTISGGTVTIGDGVTFGATLAGSSVLVKNGSFNFVLNSASARTGVTTLNNGGLRLGDATALGSGALTINAGSLALSDATARTVSNAVVLGGNATIGEAGSGALTLSGTVGLGGATRTLTVASNATLTGVISNGSLTKAGNGTLTLTAANIHTNTTIETGAVAITAANALGTTGTVTLNNANTGSSNTALNIDATSTSVTLARAINVANQGTGVATIGGSTALASANSAVFSGAITLANDVTLSSNNVARTDFSGGISGTGNVTVATAGSGVRVIFLGATANTYVGSTTITAGSVLQLSDGTARAIDYIPDAGLLTVNGTLKLAKGANSETVGGLAGSGEVRGHEGVASIASSLVINTSGDYTFSGVLSNGGAAGSTLSLTKSGTGTQNLTGSNATIYTGTTTVSDGTLSFANGVVLTGNTTVNGGRLVFNGNSSIGSGLISSGTAGEVSFGANTLTIGNATGSNQFYFGKLTGTGTLQLRGGSLTIQNADGTTAGTGANFEIWTAATSVIQSKANQFFALDTGSSLTDRKDFAFINDTGDILNLSKLSGYGAIRNDAGGTSNATSVRALVVDQSTDTVFNGALLTHRSSGNAQRSLSLTKQGSGELVLAGFIGKSTTSAGTGTGGGVALTVEAGILSVTNAYNTTTSNTAAIDLGVVTVTGGTLGFSDQALLNTAGNVGATRIALNGGILRWNTGNTQDLSAGGRLKINDGVVGQFNTNGNDVTLGTALALGTAKTGGLTKLGNGTLTLSAVNTYTGITSVSTGTLKYGVAGAFGTSEVRIAGGTLDLNSIDITNTIVFTGSGGLANYGSWTGAFNIGYNVSGSDLDTLMTSYGRTSANAVAGSTVSLSGLTKDLVINGGSVTNFSTYTGTLTVKTALNLTAASTGGALRLETGGSINYGSRASTDTIQYVGGGLTNASNYTGNLNVVGTGLALTAGNLGAGKVVVGTGTSVSIGAVFTNAIRLTGGSIVGSTLNNYNGTVTVASGQTLDLDGASNNLTISNTSANITLETGAILKGNATVGAITVQAGGILAPGNSPGQINASSLTLNGNSSMNFEVAASTDFFGVGSPTAGTDYDTIVVTNLLDLSALSFETRFNLNLLSVGDGIYGDPHGWDANSPVSFVLFTYGSLNLGDNESITSLFNINSDGFLGTDGFKVLENHFSITNDTLNSQIMLNYSVVPEPSTYGIILGGLALAAAAIRRRRQAKA